MEDMQRARIEKERVQRLDTWRLLQELGNPAVLAPAALRELGLYAGQQGVYVDKARTGPLSDSGSGITVSLLHRGSHYADDLFDDGLIYHYPRTARPVLRDRGEIEATKECLYHSVPLFVISQLATTAREVRLGWVEDFDDDNEVFLVGFGDKPPQRLRKKEGDGAFSLVVNEPRVIRSARSSERSSLFKFLVQRRYGSKCAVCDMSIPELLQAAHLRPVSEQGSDDPRNGLMLCVLHHMALDAGLFSIEPESLLLQSCRSGVQLSDLGIKYDSISHLSRVPHPEALRWHFRRWRPRHLGTNASTA